MVTIDEHRVAQAARACLKEEEILSEDGLYISMGPRKRGLRSKLDYRQRLALINIDEFVNIDTPVQ